MKQYILALDEGTTSARSILFDRDGRTVAVAQKEFPQYYPKEGYVEQDAMELYAAQYETMLRVIDESGIDVNDIAAIGITNQRETVIVWDKKSGKPICPAIVWQCRRTAPICQAWLEEGKAEWIRGKTGLLIDAYFSGSKLKWILDEVPGARERAERGELLCGTVDTWLIWNLTGGAVHATDVTNASRTMLYNITDLKWDSELLALCGVPESMLPCVQPSASRFGEVQLRGVRIPITGVCGDQQSALFGQGCFEAGSAKNTYGTGCFLLTHTGNKPVFTTGGLLTTMAAMTEEGKPEYALEGSVFVGGAVIQWLRDELGLITSAPESEEIAASVSDTGGVYIVPAFSGLGAPYWNMYARGTIVGLTRGNSRARIVRAALESIAYQTSDVMTLMAKETGAPIQCLRADGGASRNQLLMQFQSDLSGCTVEIGQSEATALGAAFLAGLTVGFFKDKSALTDIVKVQKQYFPRMEQSVREIKQMGWERAVAASLLVANSEQS